MEHVVWDRKEDVEVSENLFCQERLKKLRPYSERKESSVGAFLPTFRSAKRNCVYAFFLAWKNQLGQNKIEWGVQNETGKDVSLCQWLVNAFMLYHLGMACCI